MELKVPDAILERAEAIARETDRSAESVMLDGLSLLFGALPDMELEPEALKDFADEQLWALVHRRLTPKQDARLRDLLSLGNQGQIRNQDEGELAQLVAIVDQQMVLRSTRRRLSCYSGGGMISTCISNPRYSGWRA